MKSSGFKGPFHGTPVRVTGRRLLALACLAGTMPPSAAADAWGFSLAATSDYLVRGVSRTNDHAAVQLDAHYQATSGLLAGLFASNAQFSSGRPAEAEANLYAGFAWVLNQDWRSKVTANFYAYPWSRGGSKYNYAEADWDLNFRDSWDVRLVYSPDAPRFLPYRGLFGAATEALEVNVQRPVWGSLSAAAGAGYSYVNGPDASGYGYWSAGAAYDVASLSLSMFYVDTTSSAKSLFYNAAGGRHWVATAIWRF